MWPARRETAVAVIQEINADLVGLQEVTDAQHADLQATLGATYAFYAAGELRALVRRDSGITVTDTTVLPLTSADDRVLLTLHLTGDLVFAVTHAAGDAASLQQIRAALPVRRVLLVGDFNAFPGPNPWFPELQSIFTHDAAWRDVYATVTPLEARKPSGCGWGSCAVYLFGIDGRIDWVLATADLQPLAAETWIRHTPTGGNVSDHWPVSGSVKLR